MPVEYFYALLAMVGFAGQFSLLKRYQARNVGPEAKSSDAAERTFFFMAGTCLISSVLFFGLNAFRFEFAVFSAGVALALACVSTAANCIAIIVLSHGKMAVFTLFTMLGGMTLPFIAGTMLWDETLTAPRLIGLLILALSLFLPVLDKTGGGRKGTKAFYVLCFLTFGLSGMYNTLSKYHASAGNRGVTTDGFLILFFLFTAALNALLWLAFILARRRNGEKKASPAPNRGNALNMLGFSAVAGLGYKIQLLAAAGLDASQLYPAVTGGTLLFSAAAGYVFFRERPNKYSLAGIAAAIFAILLFVY